jgi:hypothetical protein
MGEAVGVSDVCLVWEGDAVVWRRGARYSR